MRRFFFVALFLFQSFVVFSQTQRSVFIKSLDVAASLGTMGISVDASVPINDIVSIRAGVSYMPEFNTKMSFGVQVGTEPEKKYDDKGERIKTKFDKMSEMFYELTGYKIDESVDMDCSVNFVNAKLMVDIKPFTNKDWYISAGFFWGTRIIGKACNTTEDMTSTLAVGFYNRIYDKVYNFEPIIEGISLPYEYEEKILRYGKMGMRLGSFNDKVDEDGKSVPYMMVPDQDGTVRANIKVNSFKPYLGFGWKHTLVNSPKWSFGFEAGAIFWGGVPNIYTHDGTSLTRDVSGVSGKAGDIVSLVKAFPVYPLLEFRVTRRIF